jgi:alanine or glycine:cation symporter, AGCS family
VAVTDQAKIYVSVGVKLRSAAIPVVGPIVLTVGLLTFVFSTILDWSYYGEKAAEYLLGSKAVTPYRWVLGWSCHGGVGVDPSGDLGADGCHEWADGDPNLVSLIALNRVLVSETRRRGVSESLP